MNMKNLIKYGFIAVVSCFLLSCEQPKQETKHEEINRIAEVVEFDGCEYVLGWRTMAHKGNCKNPIHKYNCN